MKRGAPLLIAAVAALYFALFAHYGILLEDEGLMLLQIARTFRGDRPYLDFHTGYPVGTFYLNATLFRVFGESVIPVRLVLAVVNGSSAGLVFALARERAGAALAAMVALGWAAYLPVFVGLFASFNVPYPSWYADCAFLATQLAFDRHLATGRRLPLVAAGVAAGVAFFFKQNTGVLAALACGLAIALQRAGRFDRDRHLARVVLVLAALLLLTGFTVAVTTVEAVIIIGPTVALIVGRLFWARGAGAPTERIVPGIALVAVGMIAVSSLWLAPFLALLGPGGILHEIFLIGTNFDTVYATPYPLPVGVPANWAALGAVGIAAAAMAGVAVERRRIRPVVALGMLATAAAVLGALVVRWSRLPEGLARGTMLQVQHLGFFAAPLLGLVMALAWLRRMREPPETPHPPFGPRLVATLVFALCSYAQLYPRIDPTHLIVAIPSMLVLAAWAARRAADAWSAGLGIPRRMLTVSMSVLGVTFVLIAAVPNFGAFFTIRDGALQRRGQIAVASTAAPVYLDDAHASDVRALNALLGYLRERLRPGEALFGFPALPLVPYLLGHPSASRHDYWYAGRPDHLEEAEVVRRLASHPPRFILSINRNIGFFSNSARYYFILRAFVQERYALVARLGRYDVLARREVATEPLLAEDFTPSIDGDFRTSFLDPLHEPRHAATLALLDRAGSAAGVAPLAEKVAPDEASRLLLMRSLVEAPDLRAVPFLVQAFATAPWRLRKQAGGVLNFIALNAFEHRYQLGRTAVDRELSPTDLIGAVDLETARRWLSDRRARREVGLFAVWLLAAAEDATAVPLLRTVYAQTTDPYLEFSLLYALVRIGRLEYLCDLTELLGDKKNAFQDAIPSLLIESAADHPTELTLCLNRALADFRGRAREMSAWTAGAAHLPRMAAALREALNDPERRVRIAATWALGRLGDHESRPALVRLAGDRDEELRSFAVDALARLDGRAP